MCKDGSTEVAWLDGECIRGHWYNADSFAPLNTDPNANCRSFYKGALSPGRTAVLHRLAHRLALTLNIHEAPLMGRQGFLCKASP